ncbi:nuclear transport factor 2 family protein [Oricola indica]|jgi:ketosteroid isomerase-like protein|uniref:nuclear transport factor 2 family protein n=1 Tax=Oricola indica TaxID=2872591 RepID=UPI001CBDFFC8|nr:nuclear transport factor 2 family protein [Oricola indica]
MSAKNEVLAASAKFYEALNRMATGDAAPMADIWSRSDDVSAQHPIGGRDEGYDTVVASFAKVAELAGGGEIRLLDQKIDAGSDMAVETGVETGTLVIAGHEASLHQRVTNVYRRTDGDWKLAHHHTDLSDSMMEILKLLNAAA